MSPSPMSQRNVLKRVFVIVSGPVGNPESKVHKPIELVQSSSEYPSIAQSSPG